MTSTGHFCFEKKSKTQPKNQKKTVKRKKIQMSILYLWLLLCDVYDMGYYYPSRMDNKSNIFCLLLFGCGNLFGTCSILYLIRLFLLIPPPYHFQYLTEMKKTINLIIKAFSFYERSLTGILKIRKDLVDVL